MLFRSKKLYGSKSGSSDKSGSQSRETSTFINHLRDPAAGLVPRTRRRLAAEGSGRVNSGSFAGRSTAMPFMDRNSFITLLDKLGDADDAVCLAAAREIHQRMQQSNLQWSDLLVPVDRSNPAEVAEGEPLDQPAQEIGRASCRERVENSVVG